MSGTTTFVCGGYFRPGPRTEVCANELHDWPLPSGYGDAYEVAMRRLRTRWANARCPDCNLYGWRPGTIREGEDVRVAATSSDKDGSSRSPEAITTDGAVEVKLTDPAEGGETQP